MISRLLFIIIIVGMLGFQSNSYAQSQLRIVGSSTVYPFAASVAEHFGKAGDFRTPVVESTGTGAGFKLFCSGIGAAHPYISNASRAILASERDQCAQNGITDIIEAKFGFDGITISNALNAPLFHLTRKELFLALAAEIPQGGKMVKNPYQKWSELNASLPDLPIKIYGTPPVSGTYDTFIELVMKKGCEQVDEMKTLISDAILHERACKTLREDGKFIEVGENGNLIAQKLIADTQALGVIGFSFLDQNAGRIKASIIEGKAPAFESIQDGSYPISRLLYFYIKATSPLVSGIKEYAQEFMSEGAIGDEGYLVEEGLVPLPKAEREKTRKALMQMLK